MGHVFDGSRGSWVTLYDPFAALCRILMKLTLQQNGPVTVVHKNYKGIEYKLT